ncbi:MAG: hypothetical protein IKP48_11420 [Bacteroidaceae bacterium]|nr:hypothetical protein [Bacteroidaceae bacterium]
MKKTLYTLTLLALAACQSEEYAFIQSLDNTQELEAATKNVITSFQAVFADNVDTRTELVDGKKVKWLAGDQITVIPAEGESIYTGNATTFTADKDGYTVKITGSVIAVDEYYALYPSSAVSSGIYLLSESQSAFGMTIPTTQLANANTFADDLNLGFAHTTSLDLSFKNVNALIKFQLTGSAISNLAKIRIIPEASMGDTPPLSGELLLDTSNGEFIQMNGEGSYVELTGEFVANTSYYMVTAPVSMPNGFSMTFIDKDGKEYVKYANKNAELKAGEILNLGEINVETSDFVINGEMTIYHKSSRTKAVPFVVIAEGYTADELNLFNQQATRMLDFFFSVEPYKTYKDYFNIYIIPVASAESGADVIDEHIDKNTYFGAGWDRDDYSNMAANLATVNAFVKENCPDIKNGDADLTQTPIIMIVNDTRSGGICHAFSDGSGYTIVPTSLNNLGSSGLVWEGNNNARGITNTGTWMNTALHEGGGHCFGRFGDEYWYNNNSTYPSTTIGPHSWPVPYELNVTANKNNPQWSMMIPSTPGNVETGKFPYAGLYEGGMGYGKSIWRSEEISCMDDNRAYFSAYQRYLIVQRIFDIVGEPFDYNTFLANDKQYKDIQNGAEFAGTEGLLTTSFDGLNPIYNASSAPANYVESPVTPMPPSAPPVLHEVGKAFKTVISTLN